MIGLLTESVDKFCTLAVPIGRFVSESTTFSTSSAASKWHRIVSKKYVSGKKNLLNIEQIVWVHFEQNI